MVFLDRINNFKNLIMKQSYYLLFIFSFILLGCSKNSTEVTIVETPVANFQFFVNGNLLTGTFTSAFKKSHTIHLGTDRSDTSFLISFDENGHFGKIIYKYQEPISGTLKTFTSFRDNSSNNFNFQLISYDAVNKRVKVNFSGYIYIDPTNLNSESKFINGNFDLPVKEYVPPVANIINEAKINGVYWRATNKFQTRGATNYHNITLQCLNDEIYKIMISFRDELGNTTLPGVYNFINTDVIKKVQIAKYNPATASYVYYNCTGTVSFINIWNYCIQGTYNLTAVNPNNSSDIITVENGNFKLEYNPFN
jgi:hypothetical protein